MKVSKQMKDRFSVAVLIAVLFGMSASTRAAVTTLSGGDSGDGWSAPSPSSVIFAYNLGLVGYPGGGFPDAVDQTIQNITFVAWTNPSASPLSTPPGITITTSAGNGNYPQLGTTDDYDDVTPLTANDTAMSAMIRDGFYNAGGGGLGPLTFTISGLTVGGQYRVDAFTHSPDANRLNETFTINNGTPESFDELLQISYLVSNTVAAVDGGPGVGGQIVISISNLDFIAPTLSGLVLSAVPEPSGISLLCLGTVFGFARLRRRLAR